VSDPTPDDSSREDETRRAGRGLLLITTAKVVFIITGYAIQVALPRLFHSEQVYGLFSVAFGAGAILNNILIASTVQTVSKMVSEDERRAGLALRYGLGLQTLIGAILGGALCLAAPWIAGGVLLDAALTPLIRIAGGVAFAYAVYAVVVGYLNGRHQFRRQASLDMTFSLLRTVGLCGGAALGMGALGAMGGFGAAAGTIVLIALATIGIGQGGGKFSAWRWLTLMAPIWIYQGCLNGILQIDLQMLKRTATELALGNGMTHAAAAHLANEYSGHYRAAQVFAFVPYQLILSVTFVVFPFVARATSTGDAEATKRYIRNAMRFSLLVLLAFATPIGGAADGVMRIAYPDGYLSGAHALEVLVFAQVALALFVIGATILTSAGRPQVAAVVGFLSLIVVLVATRLAIQWAGLDEPRAVVATALGTFAGTGVALLAVGLIVWRGFGAFIPPITVLRGGIAGAVGFFVARFVPHGSAFGALIALAAGFFAFIIALAGVREIGGKELAALRTIVRRKRS
jgi:stage V sporulation protein B